MTYFSLVRDEIAWSLFDLYFRAFERRIRSRSRVCCIALECFGLHVY